jgi:vitamin K-dependent gamma-carboxylase
MAYGVVGLLLAIRFFAHGWIDTLYIQPEYHFSYPGFGWVSVWPGSGMYFHFALLGLAAAGIALGYRYRLSAAVFAVLLIYLELIDRSLYLNHYYWMTLTAALLPFLSLNRRWSLDSRSGRVTAGPISMGAIWLLRFQVGMVYFFAGVAKLDHDWLLDGQPLATWLPARSDLPVIGPFLATAAVPLLLSWTAAAFDLTVVGWLLWKRTRPYAYAAVIMFHTATWLLFPRIGLFPLLMSLGALVFFEPDWPDRLLNLVPSAAGGLKPRRRGTTVVVGVYMLLMVVIPMRHFAIPGDVDTGGEGYLGSWHVMLTEKTGSVRFHIEDPATGRRWQVPAPEFLTAQQRMVMPTDSEMIRQTAALISKEHNGAPVSATAWLAVNGRPSIESEPVVLPLAEEG